MVPWWKEGNDQPWTIKEMIRNERHAFHSKYVLPSSTGRAWNPDKALGQSVTARPIAPHLHASSRRDRASSSDPQAINPAAQALGKGSPCRRRERRASMELTT